jgi:hypothetical protein
MDITEMLAGELNYLNAPGRPKVTALRNVRRVKSSQHAAGYSFIFEAEINGKWKTYGPDVNGNWTVEHGKPFRFPATDLLWKGTDTGTIDIGWYSLDKFFANLPLEE